MSAERQLDDLAYSLGRRFAEERDRLRDTAAGIIAEIGLHKTQALLDIERRMATVKDGEPGPAGPQGERGEAGIGEKGLQGERGEKGDPGPAGEPGRDGATGEARGRYDPEATYGKLDRVAFNGSEWIARKDEPGDLPGDGWMLAASRGERGKPGGIGEPGPQGEPGIGIRTVSVDGYAFVLTLTNGKAVTLDATPMFVRFLEERGE